MPPVIIAVALGAGIYTGIRLMAREVRRVGRLLEDEPAEPDPAIPFERDPKTGVYRLD